MKIGDLIQSYRYEHHLSMDRFAKKAGLSKAYISMLEKNQHPKTKKAISPSLDTIKAVSFAIEKDFNEVIALLETSKPIIYETDTPDSIFSSVQEKSRTYHIQKINSHIDDSISENELEEIIDYIEFIKNKKGRP